MSKYISCAETAKIIRRELKSNFPGIKFSVRSSTYAGGASISIEWLDGPTSKAVESVVDKFAGARFDGMIDLQTYVDAEWNGEKVHFGADYVQCRRRMSRTFVEAIVAQFITRFGQHKIEVVGDETSAWIRTNMDYSTEHWLREILCCTDASDMHRAYEAKEEQEARSHAQWEAGAEERERQAEAERDEREKQEQERLEREQREEERRQREQQEQQQREQEQQQREAMKILQRAALTSKYTALAHLGLSGNADRNAIMTAWRAKVKEVADGKGGYNADMDFLVRVKERALGV